ncbi:hypothetical protein THAOC_28831, partial [Thalassiosira oceanica]
LGNNLGTLAGNPAPGGEVISSADEQQKQPQTSAAALVDPRTPLTMMRSVQASISRDRSEIDGARRPLFQGDDGGGPGGADAVEGSAPRGSADARISSPPSDEPQDYEDPEAENVEEEGEDPYAALSDRAVPHPNCVPYGAEVTVRLRNPTSLLTLRVRRPGTAVTTGALGKRSVFLGGEDDDGEFGAALPFAMATGLKSPRFFARRHSLSRCWS